MAPRQYVKGYTRPDGRKVAGYWRTVPERRVWLLDFSRALALVRETGKRVF